MQAFKTAILVASLAALAGCASWGKSSVANYGYAEGIGSIRCGKGKGR
jgi:hypothetical protein